MKAKDAMSDDNTYGRLATLLMLYRSPKPPGVAGSEPDWKETHRRNILALVAEKLPSGGGFDNGTQLDLDASTPDKLVFTTAFQHMSDHGYYDGWTEHTVTITPSFIGGVTVKVSGKNRNDIKDYIAEVFHL